MNPLLSIKYISLVFILRLRKIILSFFALSKPAPPCVCTKCRHSSRQVYWFAEPDHDCLLLHVASNIFVNSSRFAICIFHSHARAHSITTFPDSLTKTLERLFNLLKILVMLCGTVRFLCHTVENSGSLGQTVLLTYFL